MQEADSAGKRVTQMLEGDVEDITDHEYNINICAEKLADVSTAIVTLWKDEGFKQCFRRSREYQLIDSAGYFLDRTEQICDPAFCPSDQDILR